jgi:hypothetical protein
VEPEWITPAIIDLNGKWENFLSDLITNISIQG